MFQYLAHKKADNCRVFRFKRNEMKSMIYIANEIKSQCDIEDITLDKTSKLLITIDRRGAADFIYISPVEHKTNFNELYMNYFIGFKHTIINNNGINSVISHLKYGINCMIR
eukprot:407101_1